MSRQTQDDVIELPYKKTAWKGTELVGLLRREGQEISDAFTTSHRKGCQSLQEA